MKSFFIIVLFCLFSVACVTSGPKARSVATAKCTIENYKSFVFPDNADLTQCDLQGAHLREAILWYADLQDAKLYRADNKENLEPGWRLEDLQDAKFYRADFPPNIDSREVDLRGVKVTCAQADYLEAQGFTGFESPSWLACLFE